MKETIIQVFGRVQGVFYRAHAKEKAEALGLAGWVRNNPDGSVTACIQGTNEKADEFIEWCNNGPDAADVSEMNVKIHDTSQKYTDFIIL